MSKFKTPREKKLASLLHDRRNVFGEDDKSSRKNIPQSKQRSHQGLRRAAKQRLVPIAQLTGEDIDYAEATVLSGIQLAERQAFQKRADAPLADTLHYQRSGSWTPLPTDPRGYR